MKKIEHILYGREKQITASETVRQPLPHKDFRFANPFIVLHHAGPATIKPGAQVRIHPHPHRGFAPYTFMLQGEGFHRDNAGNDEVIEAGDVQWMFAGKGILHSEGPTKAMLEQGGVQELVQLWINVPAVNKWDRPFYQSASRDQLPAVLQQEGVHLRLASGEYDGQTGPIQQFSPVISLVGEIEAGRQVLFPVTPGYWCLLYVIKGSVVINGAAIPMHNLVVFGKEGNEFLVKASEDAQVLFLSAEPLEEPVAAKDNFVMNTREEVDQAIEDYKNGRFGELDY